MKEATGELNMTVITLVAITAIAAVFYFVVYPLIQQTLVTQTCRSSYGQEYTAVRTGDSTAGQGGNNQAKVGKWECCPKGTTAGDDACEPIQDGTN